MSHAETRSLAAMADRTGQLFTLPAVAMEVLRLTDEPKVDARALCTCLEGDPALAAKLLRVVNSSLYGLPREIASLAQAIALIGVQPLKLLVLGFALPDDLLQGVSGEALRRYWTETLTTATAAREVAQAGWQRLGDEALAAGLMQGVGQLALLKQLGDEYADLLGATTGRSALEARRSPLPLEREALGFDHRELSAELVRRWRLPERLAQAINHQADDDPLDHLTGDEACLAQSLRLANQLTQLVVGGDLMALRRVMDDGANYCGLSKRQINAVVESLQARVGQLAQGMAVELAEGSDYRDTLFQAHARLALLSEKSAVRMLGDTRKSDEIDEDERLGRELLTETRRLSAAMRVFLGGGTGPRTDDPSAEADDGDADDNRAKPRRPHCVPDSSPPAQERLVQAARESVVACRERRQALSLAVIELTEDTTVADADVLSVRAWLAQSEWAGEFEDATWVPITRDRCAVMLPEHDRLDANRLWTRVGEGLIEATPLRLDAGVAGVSVVSRGFDAARLLEAADRCLDAARAVAGPAVKSIEVF